MKRLTIFILLMTALKGLSQTVSLPIDTSRKFCYTSDEVSFWISSVYTAETYIKTTDSLFVVLNDCNEDKTQLKGIIDDCNSLNKSYKKTLKKRNLAVRLWQFISGGISALFVYREVSRL